MGLPLCVVLHTWDFSARLFSFEFRRLLLLFVCMVVHVFALFCSGGTVVCLFVLVIVLSNGFLLLLCVFFLRSFFFHLFSPWVAGALFLVARFQRWNKE